MEKTDKKRRMVQIILAVMIFILAATEIFLLAGKKYVSSDETTVISDSKLEEIRAKKNVVETKEVTVEMNDVIFGDIEEKEDKKEEKKKKPKKNNRNKTMEQLKGFMSQFFDQSEEKDDN